MVWENNLPRQRTTNVVGPANFLHWREMNRVFEDLAAITFTYSVTVTGNGEPEELQTQSISAQLFSILGVQPAIGRGFTEAETVPEALGRDQRSVVEAALPRRPGDPWTADRPRRARPSRSSA